MEIKITAGPGKSLGRSHRFKTASSVTSAAVLRLINITFHDQDRMPPTFLPVGAQASEAQSQDARGQIGIAQSIRHHQEAAVIGHQPQSAGALTRAPTDPSLAR